MQKANHLIGFSLVAGAELVRLWRNSNLRPPAGGYEPEFIVSIYVRE